MSLFIKWTDAGRGPVGPVTEWCIAYTKLNPPTCGTWQLKKILPYDTSILIG